MVHSLLAFLILIFLISGSIADCDEESCEIMAAAPWIGTFSNHLKKNPMSAGTLSLATVEQGKPRVRTVLFQGIVEKDGKSGIAIKTSRESRKIRNSDSTSVECCFWLQETMVQFRLSGNMVYGEDELERKRVWNSLNSAARSQFFYSGGLDESTSGLRFQEEQEEVSKRGLQVIPDSFMVGVLYPEEIDFLDLGTLERRHWMKNEDMSWTVKQGYAPPVVSTV